jgi:hypothetical protein
MRRLAWAITLLFVVSCRAGITGACHHTWPLV